jgi:hypothetical protein
MQASYTIGKLLGVVMAVLAISAISFIIYNIMDALSLPQKSQGGKDKKSKEHPIRKRFILSNINNMVVSLVVTALAAGFNREWLTGSLRIMWALILLQFIYLSWSSSLKLERTMKAMSASAGQVTKKTTGSKARNQYWRSLKSLTGLISVVVVGLAGIAAIKMIDTEEPFFPKTPAFGASSVLADVVGAFLLIIPILPAYK